MEPKFVVDFSVKKTETGWLEASDQLWLAAVPKLFEWFRWVLTLGALSFVAKKGHTVLLQSVVSVTYGFVLLYYFAYFAQFHFRGLPFIKGPRMERFVSISLSSIIAYATYEFVATSVNALVASQL